MIVDVDGDAGVRARAVNVRIEVFARARAGDSFAMVHESTNAVPVEAGRWGPRAVLFPEGRDPVRGYRVVAIAVDDAGDEITRTSVISGYVEGVTLHFRLYLQSSCEGVDCEEDETCRDGACVDAFVDPRDLLDGGVAMDAGGGDAARDGGSIDAPGDAPPVCGDCDDGLECTIDRCVDGECVHDTGCDDFVVCTVDACATDGSGACTHVPDVSLCTGGGPCAIASCDPTGGCSFVPDSTSCADSDPCTNDVCVLVEGCRHEPLTGVACDDGVYCNGLDSCVDGACDDHVGVPCPGGLASCDEVADRCTGCLAGGCPGPMIGAWSGCTSTGPCTGERTRTTITSSCNAATDSCDSSPSVETDTTECENLLEGTTCGSRTCDPTGPCGGFGSTCDESGTIPRDCARHVCSTGTCTDVADGSDSIGCMRDTEGVGCALSCGGYTCSYVDACVETGTSERVCMPSYCMAESCLAGPPFDDPNPAGDSSCDRPTDGTPCGACLACGGGTCITSTCGMDGGPPTDAGFDAGGPTDGGSEGGIGDGGGPDAGGLEDGGSIMTSDGGRICSAPCCTDPGLCSGSTPFCCPPGMTPDGCSRLPCAPGP